MKININHLDQPASSDLIPQTQDCASWTKTVPVNDNT